MNVVDSCGWIEYLLDGPNARFFSPAIEDTGNLIVPTICLLEAYKAARRVRGEAVALKAVSGMREGRVVDLDADIAVRAARIGLDMKLPLADSIILATARAHRAALFTQDAHFEEIEEVKYRAAR